MKINSIDFYKHRKTPFESKEKYNYLDVNLFGVNPSFGPSKGGQYVTLYGQNMNIGSNRSIFLSEIECREISNNGTHLNCISGSSDIELSKKNLSEIYNTIKLIIDTNLFNVSDYTQNDVNSSNDENKYEWFKHYKYENEKILHPIETQIMTFSVYITIGCLTILFLLFVAITTIKYFAMRNKNQITANLNCIEDNVEMGVTVPKKLKEYASCSQRDPKSTLPILPDDNENNDFGSELYGETIQLLKDSKLLIDRKNLFIFEAIGLGQFGSVYKGFISAFNNEFNIDVAIKTLKNHSLIRNENDVNLFLKEGIVMRDFNHKHVLSIIGVCFDENNLPLIILPFMENGDMLSYIRDESNKPTVKNLMQFSIDIAKGMDYLSSQKFIHRDLAARNCLIDISLCVKIADFGLSIDVYEKSYYKSVNQKCKLPVKWMAPESLEFGNYSDKSDVWSFGVVVWELLTRGLTPYSDVDNLDILKYLKQGRRMSRPIFCPQLLYELILECWSSELILRPTFKDLVYNIQLIITKLENEANKQNICENVTYVNFPVESIDSNNSETEL